MVNLIIYGTLNTPMGNRLIFTFNEAELTLFHCMLFLKDWLNFFNLLGKEFYFAFEEGL